MRFGRPGSTGFGSAGFGGGPGGFTVTPWVKRLLIANAVVFLVSVGVGFEVIADLFAFSPSRLATRPWGMLTYMFVHQGLWHLLINLLFIFFFGPPLEARWGSDLFIKFYLVCGLGGVLLSFVFSGASIVGASAACYGIMLSFAMIWPNTPVYIWGLVPVRVKWLVVFLVLLSFASAIGPARDGVAHLAHLGGAVAGFLLVQSGWLPGSGRSDARGPGWGTAARGRRRKPWRSTLGRRDRSGRGPKAYTSGPL
ncbi:MAG: rhomboid family intramembrane serine protease, partial [Gemmatimonadota bacterium]|nr:rhomboid family intramembrane serine protease [Gemmatimonadota bacterium]